MNQPYYTRQTLADECGIKLRCMAKHLRLGTCQINKAVERIPGLGVRINGRLAGKFIQVMKAKKLSTHIAV